MATIRAPGYQTLLHSHTSQQHQYQQQHVPSVTVPVLTAEQQEAQALVLARTVARAARATAAMATVRHNRPEDSLLGGGTPFSPSTETSGSGGMSGGLLSAGTGSKSGGSGANNLNESEDGHSDGNGHDGNDGDGAQEDEDDEDEAAAYHHDGITITSPQVSVTGAVGRRTSPNHANHGRSSGGGGAPVDHATRNDFCYSNEYGGGADGGGSPNPYPRSRVTTPDDDDSLLLFDVEIPITPAALALRLAAGAGRFPGAETAAALLPSSSSSSFPPKAAPLLPPGLQPVRVLPPPPPPPPQAPAQPQLQPQTQALAFPVLPPPPPATRLLTHQYSGDSACSHDLPPQTRRRLVLFAEDEATNRRLLTRALERRMPPAVDLKFIQVEDGRQLIDAFRSVLASSATLSCEEELALIITDNQMPNLSGIQASRELRAMGYRGVIVGVTGNALADDQQEFIRSGADVVLTKPVNPAFLSHLVLVAATAPDADAAIVDVKDAAMHYQGQREDKLNDRRYR